MRTTGDRADVLPATPDIATVAARLLHLTMGPLAEYWMGVENARIAQGILSQLFRNKNNLFSHEFANYVQVSGEAAGIELSYPSRTMKALEPRTVLQFIGAAGVFTAVRMIARSYPLQAIAESEPDEYFLAHLGVLPEFEGRGLGRKLLQHAEDRGRRAGLTKITLTVDADNERAIRLYTKDGFRISATVTFEPLGRRFSYHGYHHMTKPLK